MGLIEIVYLVLNTASRRYDAKADLTKAHIDAWYALWKPAKASLSVRQQVGT